MLPAHVVNTPPDTVLVSDIFLSTPPDAVWKELIRIKAGWLQFVLVWPMQEIPAYLERVAYFPKNSSGKSVGSFLSTTKWPY